jgi:hypothetical protein
MTGSGRERGTGLAVADRIESGNGNYPSLVRAAAGLSGGDEGERAAQASKTVIRPLAARGAAGTR